MEPSDSLGWPGFSCREARSQLCLYSVISVSVLNLQSSFKSKYRSEHLGAAMALYVPAWDLLPLFLFIYLLALHSLVALLSCKATEMDSSERFLIG